MYNNRGSYIRKKEIIYILEHGKEEFGVFERNTKYKEMEHLKGKKIVIIGTLLSAKAVINFLLLKGLKEEIIAVMDRDKEKVGKEILGFKIEWEGNINRYISDDVVFIIGSHCYEEIFPRLCSYGLENKDCLIPNFFCINPPYEEEEEVIPFDDCRYEKLYDILEDTYSKKLLKKIQASRWKDMDFKTYEDFDRWPASEDYWISVQPTVKREKAIVVDGGAYIGDSIDPICKTIGKKITHYYAFEPNESSYKILNKLPMNCESYNELTVIKKGLGDKNESLYLGVPELDVEASFERNSSSIGEIVEVQKLDSMEFETDADIYIKMDIEGSELKGLKGAENLIRTRKPSLAICVYHKANDLVNIPLYLKELVPEYKIYLCGGSHTICIAQI